MDLCKTELSCQSQRVHGPSHEERMFSWQNKCMIRIHKHCMSLSSPLLIDCVCPLVEGKRFDLVLSNLAGFGLKPWRHVSLKGAILTLYRPHLREKSGQLLKYCLPCNLKKMQMYVSTLKIIQTQSRHLQFQPSGICLAPVGGEEEVPI